jgi:hypothetical protein
VTQSDVKACADRFGDDAIRPKPPTAYGKASSDCVKANHLCAKPRQQHCAVGTGDDGSAFDDRMSDSSLNTEFSPLRSSGRPFGLVTLPDDSIASRQRATHRYE